MGVDKGFVLFLLTCALAASRSARSQMPPVERVELHGTVNILLANRSGAVLVTDSQLSFGGSPTGIGVKLFRLDDHTLCSIADWWSSPGPTSDGKGSYAASIPEFIHRFVAEGVMPPASPLEDKMHALSTFVGLNLRNVYALDGRPTDQRSDLASEVLAVTFEKGHIRLARVAVAIRRDNPETPQIGAIEVLEVSQELKSMVGGIWSPAEPVLAEPHSSAHRGPAFSLLAQGIDKDKGKSFSLQDLGTIAEALEQYTADSHKGTVGGPVQAMQLTEAGITELNAPFRDKPVPTLPFKAFNVMTDFHAEGTDNPFTITGAPLIVRESSFIRSGVILDNRIYIANTMRQSTLHYEGLGPFLLDPSNQIVHCILTLGRNVSLHSPEVEQVRRAFPDLTIQKP